MTFPQRTSWPAVLTLVGAGIVAAFQVGKAPIAMPLIRGEMGLELSEAAWLLSTFAVMGAVAGCAMGTVVTRIGARRLLPLGLLVLALCSLAGAAAPGYSLLLVTRVAEGIGYMLVTISAPALITQLTAPADRPLAFGLWGAFMPIGMTISMAAAPALTLVGWRGLWLCMAALPVLLATLVHFRVPRLSPPPGAGDNHMLADLADTLKARGPLRQALAFVPYAASYAVITGFLPTLLIERLGVSPGTAGLMAAASAAVNIVGNVITGPLLHRGLRRSRVMATAFCMVILGSLLAFQPWIPAGLAYGLCLMVTGCGGMIPASILGSAAIYAPRPAVVPVTLGLFMQGANLGQLLGPALTGAAVSALGWAGAAPALVPPLLIGLWLALTLHRAGKEP